jgi:hypothetical protein
MEQFVVGILGGAIVFGNNIVASAQELKIAVGLFAANKGPCTIVGNITSAAIQADGTLLPDWLKLNLVAPVP